MVIREIGAQMAFGLSPPFSGTSETLVSPARASTPRRV